MSERTEREKAEIRDLRAELERLRESIQAIQPTGRLAANNERQRAIIARLRELGVEPD